MRALLALTFALCALLFGTPARAAEVVLNTTQDSFYPRMIRLAASGAANGRLIASHDLGGSQSLIYESTNQGASWAQVGSITVPETWHCCSGLWEVPQQLGSTAAGTLFWATTGRNGTTHTLRIYRSTNQGRTWTQHAVAAVGNTGIWEPEFAVDSAGRLLMFYSSEEYKSGGFNQLIAHKVSTDGGLTWGSDVIDVGISDGGDLRPGMPIVRRLPNGSYVMSYEICGSRNCDVYLRTSSNGSAWGTASNMGTRVESTAGHHFSHTPTITWMNDGSPQGRLLLTAQLLRRNSNGSTNEDATGRVYMFNTNGGAGAWTEAATPLATPVFTGGDACTNYSTQLLPSADNQRVLQLAGMGCRMQFASAPLNHPVADGVYRLVAKHSGQVLDVAGCSTTPGANVQQYGWVGGDCQRWKVANVANGVYTITAQHSGQALDVNGCSTAAGGNVQQYTANNLNCQKWRIEPVGDGYYRVINQNSNLVLDVNACSTAAGANVQQWTWLGGDCQRWRFERVSPNAVANGTYKVIAKHSAQALDVNACSTAAGGNIQQWPYSGANCQRWAVAQTSDGFYEFTSVNSSLKMDLQDASLQMGANVRQWTGNSAPAQRWGIENVGAGYVRIVNKHSGRVLDVAGCSTANGANVAQWEWLGGDCQRWQMAAP
ncbi:RICIN domain-containing protein [Roseateles sp. BYS87W]|uniref:RICIN domain-containing protein n=1 Tax=Pelomonas baiyunensis TaxID=3299026 RepID=A0ABW7GT50_9BURK